MNINQEALDSFYDHAEGHYDSLSKSEGTLVLLYYLGELSNGFNNAIGSRLENLLLETIDNKLIVKRFFNVYVEVVQNIRLHGVADEQERVHGSILVYLRDEKICADFANPVTKKQASFLLRRYSEVNALDPKDLKSRYMDIMMNGEMSEKGGAGLGIITIVLRSKNASPAKSVSLDEQFDIFESSISVDID